MVYIQQNSQYLRATCFIIFTSVQQCFVCSLKSAELLLTVLLERVKTVNKKWIYIQNDKTWEFGSGIVDRLAFLV